MSFIPAKTELQRLDFPAIRWISAFAGMTNIGKCSQHVQSRFEHAESKPLQILS